MHIRFITSTPMNRFSGSGTFVGIETLARALRALGATVEVVTPEIRLPVYTLERILFNRSLCLRSLPPCDLTVGFDMDGYAIAGRGNSLHVASIKGVIADEMTYESGMTRVTMAMQARREALHVRRADAVITTSQYAAGRIQQLYGLEATPQIVPEPIDLAAWNDLLKNNRARPSPGKFILLAVCRFYPRKRLNILLKSARKLLAGIPNLEVRIVGGGPEKKRLLAECRRLGLDQVVVWRENISQAELAAEYNACHIFCLPSVQEGFGIVFLEAMAAGRPIVAASAGAIPEVVRHGILVEPGSEDALAEAIDRFFRQKELRESSAAAGVEFVKQFDAPVVARSFLSQMDELLPGRASRRSA